MPRGTGSWNANSNSNVVNPLPEHAENSSYKHFKESYRGLVPGFRGPEGRSSDARMSLRSSNEKHRASSLWHTAASKKDKGFATAKQDSRHFQVFAKYGPSGVAAGSIKEQQTKNKPG